MEQRDHQPDEDPRERSIGQLLGQLARDVGTLIRQETELAKAEIRRKTKAVVPAAGMFAGAYVVGMLATMAATASLILGLAYTMPGWLAAGIVAVVYGVIAAILAARGRDRLKQAVPAVPQRTVETIKEDAEWVKSRTTSGKTSRQHGGG